MGRNRLTLLEQAMESVNADMRATGLPGVARIVTPDWTTAAFAQAWNGRFSSTGGISPSSVTGQVAALVAVADDAQDAVMETEAVWGAWPVCPAHQLGMHARAHDGAAVWWCNGDGGHAVAPIGRLGSR